MKTLIFSIILCLVIPSISVASYIIKLKNGRKISVQYYWKESGKIFFHIYGGVVGIRKDQVKEIEEIEDLPDEKAAAKQEAPETTQGTEETEVIVVQGSGTKKGEVEVKHDKSEEEVDKKGMTEKDSYDEESYKKKKISLILELKDALEKYKRRKEHGQKETMASEYRRASRISAELENLKKEVIEKNSGILPDWWSQDSGTNP